MEICENGGCMSKLSGNALHDMFHFSDAPDLNDFEDCALIPDLGSNLLMTTDFGPLVGSDCEDAAAIAALNALSDVYAMGGTPLYATIILIVGEDISDIERKKLFSAVVKTCKQEHVSIVGGHTIVGKQTTVGLSVIGRPGKRFFPKANAKEGDILLVSKPLGTGIALRGFYSGILNEDAYNETLGVLKKSNRQPDDLLNCPYVHAMTDITGFGLIGHLSEMLGAQQGAVLHIGAIPCLAAIRALSPIAFANDYINNNIQYARERKRISWHADTIEKLALCDPQTNGPILIAASPEILSVSKKWGLTCIGEVTAGSEIIVKE